MSLRAETPSTTIAVTDTTKTFAFNFTAFSADDVYASAVDDSDSSDVTLPAYTATTNYPDNGGSITFAAAINGGGNCHLTIYRDTPLDQRNLRNVHPLTLDPSPFEMALDRTTAQIQDLDARVDEIIIEGGGIDQAAVAITGGTISGCDITVGSGKTLTTTAGTVVMPSITTAANAATFGVNIPVTGTDSTSHTISLSVDGDAGISIAATGDGAAHVGAKTISVGVGGDADVVHIGDANALVDITDAHWGITEAGVATFVTSKATTFEDAGNHFTITWNAGTSSIDFTIL